MRSESEREEDHDLFHTLSDSLTFASFTPVSGFFFSSAVGYLSEQRSWSWSGESKEERLSDLLKLSQKQSSSLGPRGHLKYESAQLHVSYEGTVDL